MNMLACIEDYPVIETAINFGVEAIGKQNALAIQIASYWMEGWITAHPKLSEDDINILRQGVKNWYFI